MTLVGCGAMGGALLEGWMTANLFSRIAIVTPEKHTVDPFLERFDTITHLNSIQELTDVSDVLILGVKPQIMPHILEDYITHTTDKTLIMSMAAGLELSFYEKALGPNKQIVRLMPNTPATVSKALCGLVANPFVTPENKKLASTIANAVGKSIWVDSDDHLDRLTAISGCGPAYVFSLVEALEKAALDLGFNTDEATLLARETVIGSAHYLEKTPHKSATDLRIQVTSPGGMTAEGVAVLQQNNALENLIKQAAKAAFQKATDLKV